MGTWKVYKGDSKSSSYSRLKQINKNNVKNLKIAWVFHTNDAPLKALSAQNESSPIVVNGIMYFTSAWGTLFAINPYNGKKIWSFDPDSNENSRSRLRGVAYWGNGKNGRILYTYKNNLFAVDAKTGKGIKSFGRNGIVNLNMGLGMDPDKINVSASSPGIIYKDLIIMGSTVGEGYNAPPGYVRAYNVKTGRPVWTFHTIPKPGDPGYDTWPEDAWKYTGAVNDWAGMSLDKKRGLVFLALGSPSFDFFGASRKGKNLFSDCVVALNAKTGKLVWYYQTVHHDLWDYDLPAPPNLITIKRDGEEIPAVAQVTKTGFIFVLNRETGKPLFPVEERKVPVSTVPMEESWPTQPFPVKPKPFTRQGFTKDDITNISKESHNAVLKKLESLNKNKGMFTPPTIKGTIVMPATKGGAEWGGAAYDPDTHVLYINSNTLPAIYSLKKKTEINKQVIEGTLYNRGKLFYTNSCASCHGVNKQGRGNDIPSLVHIEKRMNKRQVLDQIKSGGGIMPAFANISSINAQAIIAYLFQNKEAEYKNGADNSMGEGDTSNNSLRASNEAYFPSNIPKFSSPKAHGIFEGPQGYPAVKPPWGTLSAINLDTGEYEWKIPLGTHPELKNKIGGKPSGIQNFGGPIVTRGGLVFIAATRDNKFRAFDKKTGKLLWKTSLNGWGRATPITYEVKGKQFIVIALSGEYGGKPVDTIVAFSLSN